MESSEAESTTGGRVRKKSQKLLEMEDFAHALAEHGPPGKPVGSSRKKQAKWTENHELVGKTKPEITETAPAETIVTIVTPVKTPMPPLITESIPVKLNSSGLSTQKHAIPVPILKNGDISKQFKKSVDIGAKRPSDNGPVKSGIPLKVPKIQPTLKPHPTSHPIPKPSPVALNKKQCNFEEELLKADLALMKQTQALKKVKSKTPSKPKVTPPRLNTEPQQHHQQYPQQYPQQHPKQHPQQHLQQHRQQYPQQLLQKICSTSSKSSNEELKQTMQCKVKGEKKSESKDKTKSSKPPKPPKSPKSLKSPKSPKLPKKDKHKAETFKPPLESDKRERPDKVKEESKLKKETGYILFCKTARKEVKKDFPNISFSDITRVAIERWKALSQKEKLVWKRKTFKTPKVKGSQFIRTGKVKGLARQGVNGKKNGLDRKKHTYPSSSPTPRPQPHKPSQPDHNSRLTPHSPIHSSPLPSHQISPSLFIPPHIDYKALHAQHEQNDHLAAASSSSAATSEPVTALDAAAHLKLLGESLTVIGTRLVATKTPLAVQGGLSVLMDSLLCAMSPLLALTNEIPEVSDPQLRRLHAQTLENVSYIMPGM